MKYITVITACLILFGCSFNKPTSSETSLPEISNPLIMCGGYGTNLNLWDLYYMSIMSSGTVPSDAGARIATNMLQERSKRF